MMFIMKKNTVINLILASLLFCFFVPAKAEDNSWIISSGSKGDSLIIRLTANDTKQQLAVLMQGLHLYLPSVHRSIIFPSAPMVRNKLKHHPNEVKATIQNDSNNEEVRPDLFPLVVALCDTTTIVYDSLRNEVIRTRDFTIILDRENAILSFSVTVPCKWEELGNTDSLSIEVFSTPGNFSSITEFTGTRLSPENSPVLNGLGQASMGKDDNNRTVGFKRKIAIVKYED